MDEARSELEGLTREALGRAAERVGVPASHARAMFGALHRRGVDLGQSKGMSPAQVERVAALCPPADVQVTSVHPSPDGTEKLVFTLRDGARVEGVLIPAGPRYTFCVSSQVGCAMDCAFCATARLGLVRGLTPGEIVAQVHRARSRAQLRGRPLRNIVFMGMGEPLHHYDNVRTALEVLADPFGLAFALPRLTVSTVGLVPRIRQLGVDFAGRVQLAVSLNAGTEATRRRIMPITARYGLEELRAAIADYPLPRNRYVLLEYVVIPGVTDRPEELAAVAAFTRGLACVVNLIPFNPFDGAPFETPSAAELDAAYATLRSAGVTVTVRLPRGRRNAAACGQLALTPGGAASAS